MMFGFHHMYFVLPNSALEASLTLGFHNMYLFQIYFYVADLFISFKLYCRYIFMMSFMLYM